MSIAPLVGSQTTDVLLDIIRVIGRNATRQSQGQTPATDDDSGSGGKRRLGASSGVSIVIDNRLRRAFSKRHNKRFRARTAAVDVSFSPPGLQTVEPDAYAGAGCLCFVWACLHYRFKLIPLHVALRGCLFTTCSNERCLVTLPKASFLV